MFPKDIVLLLEKYQTDNIQELKSINENITEIVAQLKLIRKSLSIKMSELTDSDLIDNDKEEELLQNLQTLRKYINSISCVNINENLCTNEQVKEETPSITEELKDDIAVFSKKVYPFFVSDDLCPFCNVKFINHYVYYQRIVNNKLHDESKLWHRCPNCNKLFVLDYEIEDFDFENTNIILNKEKFENTFRIDIYSIIVLSNTLKCSSNHQTKDVIAILPILNEDGQISYIRMNASYCTKCNRFTILKEDFDTIKGIVICQIIDETTDTYNNDKSDIEIGQKQSVLFQYGYNVQAKKNLSDKQRHIILASLIESQIMTRREVIDHLITLIERGSKIPSWKEATQKWKIDRDFVKDYQSDSLPEVIFNSIVLQYSKSK